MAVVLARVRVPLLWASIVFAVAGGFLGVPWWWPLLVLLLAFAVYLRVGTLRRAPTEVAFPVRGRYRALNTPADKVPSHGLHAYGQTYAIDLVYAPEGGGLGSGDGISVRFWPPTLPATDFPGFGQPVLAPVDGEVVRVEDGARDHRDRTSWIALVYMLTVEALVRELRGPKGILGNHVVIRTPDGEYALVAHLQHGSAQVRVGDRVRRGDAIAACGNSGNSSEPHVHLQLMDHPQVLVAAGLPITFARYDDGNGVGDGDGTGDGDGVPTSKVPFTA
jgi:hypothetical protein